MQKCSPCDKVQGSTLFYDKVLPVFGSPCREHVFFKLCFIVLFFKSYTISCIPNGVIVTGSVFIWSRNGKSSILIGLFERVPVVELSFYNVFSQYHGQSNITLELTRSGLHTTYVHMHKYTHAYTTPRHQRGSPAVLTRTTPHHPPGPRHPKRHHTTPHSATPAGSTRPPSTLDTT